MILTRYMRSSISGGLLSMGVLALACYGGYHWYTAREIPYAVVQKAGAYYLEDKATEKRKIITKEFELGTLDERLSGIFRESKRKVVDALDRMQK